MPPRNLLPVKPPTPAPRMRAPSTTSSFSGRQRVAEESAAVEKGLLHLEACQAADHADVKGSNRLHVDHYATLPNADGGSVRGGREAR